jgi:hypothetical protein
MWDSLHTTVFPQADGQDNCVIKKNVGARSVRSFDRANIISHMGRLSDATESVRLNILFNSWDSDHLLTT